MNPRELMERLSTLGRPRVLIVGDLILDRYISGNVDRISPEAPIPVLAAKTTDLRLGGAGNVAANLRAMEAEVEVLGVVGDDGKGRQLTELFEEIGVAVDGCVRLDDRTTTEKTRLLSAGTQMLRVDWEEVEGIHEDVSGRLLDGLDARLARADAVVLSDYGKGVLTEQVLRTVIDAARARSLPVLVDPKGTDYGRYRGATLATPNKREAEIALGRKIARLEDVPRAAIDLAAKAGLDSSVITLGSEGIYYRSAEGEGHVHAVARAVFDVVGAGDTVIALLALGVGGGLPLGTAVELANHAAGIVVGRRGAASVTRQELAAAIAEGDRAESVVLTRADLPRLLSRWRSEGKRIVFTNGCFDILHAGHVAYLREARSRGDALIVGVNDDASVRRLKGPERPINPIEDRMVVLAALEMVDAVVSFGEDTPKEIVEEITPDVLVKGRDWENKGVVGREWVERHGGEVYLADLVPGRSTTSIADRLKKRS